MRRFVPTALLTVAAVPAMLAVPVVGPVHGSSARPVAPVVVTTPLAGVDPAALTAEAGSPARTPGLAGGASVERPAVLTGRRSTQRFDLVGLTWRPGAAQPGIRVQVRIRENGTWTGWQPLTVDDAAPDPGTAEASGSAATGVRDGTVPLLTSGADGVQARVDTPTGAAPAELALDLVDAGRSAADDVLSGSGGSGGPAQAAFAATPAPRIVTRAQWGADERLVKDEPVVNTSVKTLVLHHTDTTNSYSAAQAFAQVRAVYAFHTKGRGWNDIGYNFLVDRYGRTFEGRRGSLTAPIMGAHTGGFNASSLGISVLGTFTSAPPPKAAMNALVDVLAWQAGEYQINPRGTVTVVSAGTSYTKYKAGTPVRVAGVIGHRDLGRTECPGNALYPKLGAIRTAIAARMVPGLTGPALTGSPAPAPAAGGGPAAPITFTGSVPTTQRWSMVMTPFCGGSAVRAVNGTSRARISASWDLLGARGRPVPPGAYTVSLTTRSPVRGVPVWRRDVEVLPSSGSLFPSPSGAGPLPSIGTACPVSRAASSDPALTSVVAGRVARPDARTVVLVNATGGSEAFAEALAVAPFAVSQQAPVLLTGADALPDVVARDLVARGVTRVWLVGSTASISPAVEQQVRALGVMTVARIAGSDRWGTAAALAAAVGAPDRQAVLVPGDDGELLDALVAAGSAAGAGRPVLLTSRTGVPAATLAGLRALGVTSVTVVGSTAAVPDETLGALASAGITQRTRLVGAGRWASAAAIATAYAPTVPADRVVLTSGLVAGPDLLIASAQGRPILLSTAGSLPADTAAWLHAHRSLRVTVLASPDLVGTPVLRAALSARG